MNTADIHTVEQRPESTAVTAAPLQSLGLALTAREPSPYEVAIFRALQEQPVYLGYGADTVHLPRAPHGPGEVGRLEGHSQPDPRIARVQQRREKNRVARRSRRVNRLATR
ncbi:hypothetical protein KXR83_05595 [Williamsia muralis]|uniref:hypothetical protein n=1 Tax=Williamsia marianensis TaxID=85044 RepID=UPI003F18A7DE